MRKGIDPSERKENKPGCEQLQKIVDRGYGTALSVVAKYPSTAGRTETLLANTSQHFLIPDIVDLPAPASRRSLLMSDEPPRTRRAKSSRLSSSRGGPYAEEDEPSLPPASSRDGGPSSSRPTPSPPPSSSSNVSQLTQPTQDASRYHLLGTVS